MMISDDERREVARKLREYVDLPDDWWADTYSGFYVEKCAFGNVERHRESELFARLADLIEPTCDRDALLELADECGDASRAYAGDGHELTSRQFANVARRIRKALGAQDA